MPATASDTEFSKPASSDDCGPNDYRSVAREMVDNLGSAALKRAIDSQFEARLRENLDDAWFWGRVCGAIVMIRTVQAIEIVASF